MKINRSHNPTHNIPSFSTEKITITQISRYEMKQMLASAIRVWHFEKANHGVVPVAGAYDHTNPKHLKISDVVKVYP